MAFTAFSGTAQAAEPAVRRRSPIALLLLLPGMFYLILFFVTPFFSLIITSLQEPDPLLFGEFNNAFNFAIGDYTHYGEVNLSDALAVSSDAFFYRIGAEMFLAGSGEPILQDELRLFGFGQKSGIDLPYEYRGIVPDAEIKKNIFNTIYTRSSTAVAYFTRASSGLTKEEIRKAVAATNESITPMVPHQVLVYTNSDNKYWKFKANTLRGIFSELNNGVSVQARCS